MTTEHKLFNMLMASNPDEAEVEELFSDLRYIFDNPFDKAIEEAITLRKNTYVDQQSQTLN